MTKFKRIASAALLLPLLGSQARADEDLTELSLADLFAVQVVTASKRAESMDEAPNVMYVITKEDIKRGGYKSIRDILQTIPGFAVFHGDLQYFTQVRGIAPNDNEKISFMINGRIISQIAETNLLNGPITLDNIERIEVIVGPGSVLYGAQTLGGIVNMITQRPEKSEVALSVGTPESYMATGMLARRIEDDVNFMASLSYAKKTGWNADEKDRLPDKKLYGQLRPSMFVYGQAQIRDWSLQASSYNSDMPEIGLANGYWDPSASRNDYIESFVGKQDKKWNENIATTFALSYDSRRMLRTVNAKYGGDYDLSNRTYGGEAAVQYTRSNLFVQGGVQYSIDQYKHNYNFIYDPNVNKWPDTNWVRDTINPVDSSVVDNYWATEQDPTWMHAMITPGYTNALGAYVSVDWRIIKQLKLVAASRFDRNSILDVEGDDFFDPKKLYTSPRLALIYSPFDIWTVKAMYNRASKMPNAWFSPRNHLWGRDNEGKLPATEWWWYINTMAKKPEVLSAFELQSIVTVFKTRFTINGYYQTLRDYITWFSPFTNVGDFTGYGLEANVQSKPIDRLQLTANCAIARNEFKFTADTANAYGSVQSMGAIPTNKEQEMNAAPRFLAGFGADINVWQRIHLTPAMRYFTGQPAFDTAWHYIDNRFYLDLAAVWEDALPNLDVRFAGKNITDNQETVAMQWKTKVIKPQGFTIELGLNYRFSL